MLAATMLAVGMSVGIGATMTAQAPYTIYSACVNNGSGTIKMQSVPTTYGQNEVMVA